MSDSFNYGDSPTFTATFLSGVNPSDPTSVKFFERKPDGTSTSVTYPGAGTTITKVSTGVYRITRYQNAGGKWHRRWEGLDASGNILTTTEDIEYYVAPSLFH